MKRLIKVLSLLFFGIIVIKIFGYDRFNDLDGLFTNPNFLEDYNFFNNKATFILIYLLRLLTGGCIIFIVLNYFFDFKFIKTGVSFFTPIIYLLNLIFIKYNIAALADPSFYAYKFKLVIFISECLIGLLVGIIELINLIKTSEIKIGKALCFLILFSLLADYCSSLQFLFGKNKGVVVQFGNLGHLIIIIGFILLILLMVLLLKNKDNEYRRMILLSFSIAVLIKHFHFPEYTIYFNPLWIQGEVIPFNLCHLGLVLIPIALITKSRKVAVFTIINSVGGALIAFLVPAAAFNRYISDAISLHFLFNHALLIIVPYLMFKYKMFDEITKKDLKFLLISDLVYWFTITLLNLVLPNFDCLINVSYFGGNPITAMDIAGLLPNGAKLLDYVLTFNIGSFEFNVYYIWWIVLLFLAAAVTFVGFGFYKLVNIKRKKTIH